MSDKQKVSYGVLLLVVGLIGLATFIYAMKGVFATITISLVSFYMLDPIATWCTGKRIGKFTMSRLAGVIIAFTAGILVAIVLLLVMVPPIVEQILRFSDNYQSYIKQFETVIVDLQRDYRKLQLPQEVTEAINRSLNLMVEESSTLLGEAAKNTKHFMSQLMLMFMIPFMTFYLMLEKEAVKSAIVTVFPRKWQDEARAVMTESSDALRGYVVGQIILSVIMGALITLILGLMGIKAPLLLGLIAGTTKMIPVIGIFLGCVPAALVALSDSFSLSLWVIAVFTAIQLLENKIILPLFLSRYVNLSPLAILLTIVVGEQLGGILGMFVATPLFAVLHVFYTHVRKKYD